MRNLVAKHDRNRAATHLDRSKEPQLSVDEGLLDYYAENAQSVAERVNCNASVSLYLGGKEISAVNNSGEPIIKCCPLSEEDKKNRVLRAELIYKLTPELTELLDSFAGR